jgi:hypothetical protein
MLLVQIAVVLWAARIEGARGPNGEFVEVDIDGCVDDGLAV